MSDPFEPGGPFGDVDRESVRNLASFLIHSCTFDKPGGEIGARVAVVPGVGPGGEEPPFESWMTACEYFVAAVAARSGAGFEKALELIVSGAMQYRTVFAGRGDRPE